MLGFDFARFGFAAAMAATLLQAALPARASEKVVYSFKGGDVRDGLAPEAGLIGVGGTLYGTTVYGSDYGFGTVFKIAP